MSDVENPDDWKNMEDLLTELTDNDIWRAQQIPAVKYSSLRGMIICIEGIISAGKTTLGKNLVKYLTSIGLEAVFLQEFVNNKLLDLFYKDQAKYAFALQMFMVRSCMANFKLAEEYTKRGVVCIIDRCMWGNAVFAAMHKNKGNISQEEWEVYISVLKSPGPYTANHVVYLECDPDECWRRAQQRNRDPESPASLEFRNYLRTLEKWYSADMLLHIQQGVSDIIPIDWNTFKSAEYVLDILVSKREPCVIEGSVTSPKYRERSQRAAVMKKLIQDNRVVLTGEIETQSVTSL
jgi:deoxyadenosine/deoxycytidine kinase